MKARRFAASVYVELKAVFRRMVEDGFGGQKLAAAATRVGQATISDYGNTRNPDLAETQVPVDVLLDLMAETGDVRLLRFMADLAGYRLVALPDVTRTRTRLGRITGEALKETSEVFARLGGFLDDGVLSGAEGNYLDTEIDEAIDKLLALKAEVDFEAGLTPPGKAKR